MDICHLCNSSEVNELVYGEFLKVDNVIVHHFCLLFAPGLYQRGSDEEGIQGFLLEDIIKESGRVKKLSCFFCQKRYANLGCCVPTCIKAYHLDCGLKNNASLEFTKKYNTFCRKHARHRQDEKPKSNTKCGICFETNWTTRKSILLPCCKNAWFHRDCIQQYAKTAGVFFKCPMCNDKEQCLEFLPLFGIFLPEKDADWELDELFALENQNNITIKTCESESCIHGDSIFHEEPWKWKICSTCGSSAIHEECFALFSNTEFVCKSCTEILNKLKLEATIQEQTVPLVQDFIPLFSDEEEVTDNEKENTAPVETIQVIKRKRDQFSDPENDTTLKQPKRPKRFRRKINYKES